MVPSSSSAVTIEALHTMFAQHGIPNSIVSDNGSSFTSSEFQNFCKMNGIKHYTSAPYKPASNGQAERAVQIIKNGLSRIKEGSIQSRLVRMLLNYRTRPHQTTGRSPAKLLMGREVTNNTVIISAPGHNGRGRE